MKVSFYSWCLGRCSRCTISFAVPQSRTGPLWQALFSAVDHSFGFPATVASITFEALATLLLEAPQSIAALNYRDLRFAYGRVNESDLRG